MSEAKLTLNTLFGLPDETFYTKALSAGMSTEGLVTTKEKILSALRGLRWRAIETEFRDKAVDLLNMDVLDLVTSTWRNITLWQSWPTARKLTMKPLLFHLWTIQSTANCTLMWRSEWAVLSSRSCLMLRQKSK